MAAPSRKSSEGLDVALTIYLGAYCLVAACFALAFYAHMQPTTSRNPGVAAYDRPPSTIISYDLPFIFVALIPVVLTGSLRLSDIAAAQAGMPFVLWAPYWVPLGPLAFLAYIVTTLAAENRVPFDILEAESELIAGFRVEYSGMKFALIQLGEYAHVIGTSFLGALLFLGAWGGPGPAWLGTLWFLLKAMCVFLLVTWIRWSFVRIRVDQILAISWKLLLPATLVLVMATAVVAAWPRGAPVV